MIIKCGKLADFMAQDRAAAKLVGELMQYAVSIGCKLGEGACYDELICDEDQSNKLAEWWQAQKEAGRCTLENHVKPETKS